MKRKKKLYSLKYFEGRLWRSNICSYVSYSARKISKAKVWVKIFTSHARFSLLFSLMRYTIYQTARDVRPKRRINLPSLPDHLSSFVLARSLREPSFRQTLAISSNALNNVSKTRFANDSSLYEADATYWC